ncbi:MAG: hypothetical protein E6J89_09510 [Deltaproteobacteria bacterium]|nr:MAG: hypothetical protein E6J89_09510 [Deltaproteobacteria bacterium]
MEGVQDIGETAGKVWNLLQRNGKASLPTVERGVQSPKSVVHMAIGWLAREGKVELRQDKRTIELWLRDS